MKPLASRAFRHVYGKRVVKAQQHVVPGEDHAITSQTRDFPTELYEQCTHTALDKTLTTEQLVHTKAHPHGALYFWPSATELPKYMLAGCIRPRQERGEGKAGRSYTQMTTYVFPQALWESAAPELVASAPDWLHTQPDLEGGRGQREESPIHIITHNAVYEPESTYDVIQLGAAPFTQESPLPEEHHLAWAMLFALQGTSACPPISFGEAYDVSAFCRTLSQALALMHPEQRIQATACAGFAIPNANFAIQYHLNAQYPLDTPRVFRDKNTAISTWDDWQHEYFHTHPPPMLTPRTRHAEELKAYLQHNSPLPDFPTTEEDKVCWIKTISTALTCALAHPKEASTEGTKKALQLAFFVGNANWNKAWATEIKQEATVDEVKRWRIFHYKPGDTACPLSIKRFLPIFSVLRTAELASIFLNQPTLGQEYIYLQCARAYLKHCLPELQQTLVTDLTLVEQFAATAPELLGKILNIETKQIIQNDLNLIFNALQISGYTNSTLYAAIETLQSNSFAQKPLKYTGLDDPLDMPTVVKYFSAAVQQGTKPTLWKTAIIQWFDASTDVEFLIEQMLILSPSFTVGQAPNKCPVFSQATDLYATLINNFLQRPNTESSQDQVLFKIIEKIFTEAKTLDPHGLMIHATHATLQKTALQHLDESFFLVEQLLETTDILMMAGGIDFMGLFLKKLFPEWIKSGPSTQANAICFVNLIDQHYFLKLPHRPNSPILNYFRLELLKLICAWAESDRPWLQTTAELTSSQQKILLRNPLRYTLAALLGYPWCLYLGHITNITNGDIRCRDYDYLSTQEGRNIVPDDALKLCAVKGALESWQSQYEQQKASKRPITLSLVQYPQSSRSIFRALQTFFPEKNAHVDPNICWVNNFFIILTSEGKTATLSTPPDILTFLLNPEEKKIPFWLHLARNILYHHLGYGIPNHTGYGIGKQLAESFFKNLSNKETGDLSTPMQHLLFMLLLVSAKDKATQPNPRTFMKEADFKPPYWIEKKLTGFVQRHKAYQKALQRGKTGASYRKRTGIF